MPLSKIIDVDAPDEFESKLAEGLALAGDPTKCLVLLTSDAPDGVKWCEDCAEADPVIEDALKTHACGWVVVRAFCKRSDWSLKVDPANANGFYRKHDQLKATNLPTLYRWTSQGVGNKLVEADCSKSSHLQLLLDDED